MQASEIMGCFRGGRRFIWLGGYGSGGRDWATLLGTIMMNESYWFWGM